jgi:hypothetical protein
VWHLQRVVAKKKDPLSHVLFLDVLCPPGEPLLMEQFWWVHLKGVQVQGWTCHTAHVLAARCVLCGAAHLSAHTFPPHALCGLLPPLPAYAGHFFAALSSLC